MGFRAMRGKWRGFLSNKSTYDSWQQVTTQLHTGYECAKVSNVTTCKKDKSKNSAFPNDNDNDNDNEIILLT